MAKKKPNIQVRAPKGAAEFVAGRPTASGQPSTVEGRERGMVKRAGGAARAQISVYLEPEVAEKLRSHCFKRRLRVSEVLATPIAEFVRKLP